MKDKLKSIKINSCLFVGCIGLLVSNNTLNFISGGNIIFTALSVISGLLLFSDLKTK